MTWKECSVPRPIFPEIVTLSVIASPCSNRATNRRRSSIRAHGSRSMGPCERGRRRTQPRSRAPSVLRRSRMLRAAALAGLGVAPLPEDSCVDDVRRGALVHLLPEWSTPEGVIHSVFTTARGKLTAVRAFVDHFAQAFSVMRGRGRMLFLTRTRRLECARRAMKLGRRVVPSSSVSTRGGLTEVEVSSINCSRLTVRVGRIMTGICALNLFAPPQRAEQSHHAGHPPATRPRLGPLVVGG